MRRGAFRRQTVGCGLALVICMAAPHSIAQGCLGQSCPESSREVAIEPVFSHPVPHTEVPPDRLVLTGTTSQDGAFEPTGAFVPPPDDDSTDVKPPFPIADNLLRHLDLRTYGVEERTEVSREGEFLVVRCGPGQKAAGAALVSRSFRFPRGMVGNLVIEGQADANFSFAVVKSGDDAVEEQQLDLPTGVLARVASSHWNDADARREIVVICPRQGGTATISSVQIVPTAANRTSVTGTWIWNTSQWFDRPGLLASSLLSEAVTDVYLQISIEHGEIVEPEKLKVLIETLTSVGIAVHAVEGDPAMTTPAGRSHAIDRAGILRGLAETTHLRSVQYDIEPYLRPDFALDPAAGWREWAVTIRELATALDSKVEIVVPFWMLDDRSGAEAVANVRDALSAVTVMDYRTAEGEIVRIAENWLNWGVEAGIGVRIALENGPLPAEIHRTFVRAERGEVVLDRSSSPHRVLLFADAVSDSFTMPAYSLSHEVAVPPSRVSFAGNDGALTKARDRLATTLVGWPSFAGLLVHELVARSN